MNIPESEIVDTADGRFTIDCRQFVQYKAPNAPAELPVIIMLDAWEILYFCYSHLKCDLVISAPLKYNSVSLYFKGVLVDP